jgi:hypothetical protein
VERPDVEAPAATSIAFVATVPEVVTEFRDRLRRRRGRVRLARDPPPKIGSIVPPMANRPSWSAEIFEKPVQRWARLLCQTRRD